jgi:hypothetical protein
MEGRKGGRGEERKDEYLDGWIDGWTDEWAGGWMVDGWMGCMGISPSRYISFHISPRFPHHDIFLLIYLLNNIFLWLSKYKCVHVSYTVCV